MLTYKAIKIATISVHIGDEPLTIGISKSIFKPLLELDQQKK